ncbi:MAG: sulfatase [Proteobacteria bacterium]|nr:sulfatase [Pseudomonadota bacterium]
MNRNNLAMLATVTVVLVALVFVTFRSNEPEVEAGLPDQPEGITEILPVVATPNIVFIIWDTTRADRLSAYGHSVDTTPYLRDFAKEAVLYERAVAPGMWTLPSHAAMFTGLPVSAHGANSSRKWLDNRFLTMAEWFKEQGYGTYLFSPNGYVSDVTNLHQGFDQVDHPWDRRWSATTEAATAKKIIPTDKSTTASPLFEGALIKSGGSRNTTKDAGKVARDAVLQWVDTHSAAPFFVVVNYMETHVPRLPSLASRQALFDDDLIEEQLELNQAFGNMLAYTCGMHEYSPHELEVIRSTYDAAIRDLDLVTGSLLDSLDERGILDNTVVVITSDHGEQLGEHHLIGHKYSVYEPLIRVPLIIRYPQRLAPQRISSEVNTLDLFATMADLAGIPMAEGTMSKSLVDPTESSKPITELVAATPRALSRVSKVFPQLEWKPFLRTYTSIEKDGLKVIINNEGLVELYNLHQDPLESQNLANERPQQARELLDSIEAWKSTFDVYDPAQGDEVIVKGKDKAVRQQLEALGYLDEWEDEDKGEDY